MYVLIKQRHGFLSHVLKTLLVGNEANKEDLELTLTFKVPKMKTVGILPVLSCLCKTPFKQKLKLFKKKKKKTY